MRYGEIITLGRHKLMCGDATSREDVMRLVDGVKVDLVLTDPPYGMKVQDKCGRNGGDHITYPSKVKGEFNYNRKKSISAKSYPQMTGDSTSKSAEAHYEIVKNLSNKFIIWGGQYLAHFLPVNGGWIFWDKGMEKTDFSAGELAYKSWGKKLVYYRHVWCGAMRSGRRDFELQSRIHPTQKPVELHMKILEDFTQPDDVILDCFGGSGTTLIACEMTGRKCLMMEISPEYCDIIAERYNKLRDFSPLFHGMEDEKLCPA